MCYASPAEVQPCFFPAPYVWCADEHFYCRDTVGFGFPGGRFRSVSRTLRSKSIHMHRRKHAMPRRGQSLKPKQRTIERGGQRHGQAWHVIWDIKRATWRFVQSSDARAEGKSQHAQQDPETSKDPRRRNNAPWFWLACKNIAPFVAKVRMSPRRSKHGNKRGWPRCALCARYRDSALILKDHIQQKLHPTHLLHRQESSSGECQAGADASPLQRVKPFARE